MTSNFYNSKKKIVFPIEGNKISAAGILLYDDEYFYHIIEERNNKEVYLDPGGKFVIEDYDIIQTAVREFNEETFFTIPLTYFDMKELIKNGKVLKVYTTYDNKENCCKYICFLIHIKELKNLKFKFIFNKEKIKQDILSKRKNFLEAMNNINNKNCFSSTLSFGWLPRKNIDSKIIHPRLYEVLKSFPDLFSFKIKTKNKE
jgi:hypothetical protein